MMGLIRELPDWATGGVTAGAIWFGVSYVVLAPRAMDEEQEKAMPPCIEQLESEQERAIADATERATDRWESEQRSKLSEIAREERNLRELRSQVDAYEMTSGAIMSSPLGDLLGATGVQMPRMPNVPSSADVRRMQQDIRRARAAVERQIPEIDFPRVPRAELMQTCACATLKALAGKRTDYAMSLASFRLIGTEKISNTRSDFAGFLRWDGCGDKPWEDL